MLKKVQDYNLIPLFVVQMERLELSRLAALDPKSNVSTNSTTSAKWSAKIVLFNYLTRCKLIKLSNQFILLLSLLTSLIEI